MITPYTVKTNVGFEGDSPVAYDGIAYASHATRSLKRECPYESCNLYGLLYVPDKEIVVLFKWECIGRYRLRECRVISGSEKVGGLFNKMVGYIAEKRDVKVSSMAVYWFEKYLDSKDGFNEVNRHAIQYFSIERRTDSC